MKLLIWAFLFRFIFKEFHFVCFDCIRFSECYDFKVANLCRLYTLFGVFFYFKVSKPCRLYTFFGVFLISKWQNPVDCIRFSECFWFQSGKTLSILYAFRSVFDFKVAKPFRFYTLFGVFLISKRQNPVIFLIRILHVYEYVWFIRHIPHQQEQWWNILSLLGWILNSQLARNSRKRFVISCSTEFRSCRTMCHSCTQLQNCLTSVTKCLWFSLSSFRLHPALLLILLILSNLLWLQSTDQWKEKEDWEYLT